MLSALGLSFTPGSLRKILEEIQDVVLELDMQMEALRLVLKLEDEIDSRKIYSIELDIKTITESEDKSAVASTVLNKAEEILELYKSIKKRNNLAAESVLEKIQMILSIQERVQRIQTIMPLVEKQIQGNHPSQREEALPRE